MAIFVDFREELPCGCIKRLVHGSRAGKPVWDDGIEMYCQQHAPKEGNEMEQTPNKQQSCQSTIQKLTNLIESLDDGSLCTGTTVADMQRLADALLLKNNPDQGKIAHTGIRWLTTLLRKNADYGSGVFNSPILTQDMPPGDALLVRISDKISRLQTLKKQLAEVPEETFQDTVMDLGCYCLLWTCTQEYKPVSVDQNRDWLKYEKDARMYYQNIIYDVCNQLDRLEGNKPDHGIVCGTVASPTTEVQNTLSRLINEVRLLRKRVYGDGKPGQNCLELPADENRD